MSADSKEPFLTVDWRGCDWTTLKQVVANFGVAKNYVRSKFRELAVDLDHISGMRDRKSDKFAKALRNVMDSFCREGLCDDEQVLPALRAGTMRTDVREFVFAQILGLTSSWLAAS